MTVHLSHTSTPSRPPHHACERFDAGRITQHLLSATHTLHRQLFSKNPSLAVFTCKSRLGQHVIAYSVCIALCHGVFHMHRIWTCELWRHVVIIIIIIIIIIIPSPETSAPVPATLKTTIVFKVHFNSVNFLTHHAVLRRKHSHMISEWLEWKTYLHTCTYSLFNLMLYASDTIDRAKMKKITNKTKQKEICDCRYCHQCRCQHKHLHIAFEQKSPDRSC